MLGIDLVNCGYNFGVLGDAELSNKSIRKRGERENILFCIFSDEEQLEQELKRKRGKYIYIYILKVQIDRAATSDIRKARKLRHKFVKLDGVL